MKLVISGKLFNPDGNNEEYVLLVKSEGRMTPDITFDVFKSSVWSVIQENLLEKPKMRFTMSLDFSDELIENKVYDINSPLHD